MKFTIMTFTIVTFSIRILSVMKLRYRIYCGRKKFYDTGPRGHFGACSIKQNLLDRLRSKLVSLSCQLISLARTNTLAYCTIDKLSKCLLLSVAITGMYKHTSLQYNMTNFCTLRIHNVL
jgi:hypothetical protein